MMLGTGFFRLVLALTVVITHTHPIWGFTLGNPVIAVRTFFIISGFFMTLVLNEKYVSNKLFWRNRLLRIYPIYWITLLLTVGSCLGAYWLRGNWGEMHYLVMNLTKLNWWDAVVIIISHIAILGRSLVMFGNFDNLSGINYLLIPQAWALVLIITFYLLAPFILRRSWWVVTGLMVLSLVSRWYLKTHGFKGDLWNYRFFPSELIYFLMGWWSYWIYKKIANYKLRITNYLGIFLLILAILSLSTFNFWPGYILTREWFFYGLMTVVMPLNFSSSKTSLVDRAMGELSYSVYIIHILVNNIIYPLFFVPFSIDRNLQPLAVFFVSVVLSWPIIKIIQSRIERIREVKVE